MYFTGIVQCCVGMVKECEHAALGSLTVVQLHESCRRQLTETFPEVRQDYRPDCFRVTMVVLLVAG